MLPRYPVSTGMPYAPGEESSSKAADTPVEAADKHRLPVGIQIGVALLFLYLVLIYLDRRFLVIRRRPRSEPEKDAGLTLVEDAAREAERDLR